MGLAVVAWMLLEGVAWAGEGESKGGGAQWYVLSYSVVVLSIFLGLLFVCSPARRRERAKGEKYVTVGIADRIAEKQKIPVVSVGMRLDQVTNMLGRPKISRRGEDIYRELAVAGKLSEDDAAKVYNVYEHKAGRYEIVLLDKRVIQIKTQPSAEASE
jgi:hypothetical protein